MQFDLDPYRDIHAACEQATWMLHERLREPWPTPLDLAECVPAGKLFEPAIARFDHGRPPREMAPPPEQFAQLLSGPVQRLADAINAKRQENSKLAFVRLPGGIPGTYTVRRDINGVSLLLILWHDGARDEDVWNLSALLGEPA